MVIHINIQDQREFLGNRLEPEQLTSKEENETLIQTFHASKNGKGLESFFKEYAWEEDLQGNTKIYLVKDVETGEIVFYFGLCAGLLYKEISSEDYKLSNSEKAILDTCIDALKKGSTSFDIEDTLLWYEGDDTVEPDKIRKIVEERIQIKLAAREDPENSMDSKNGVNVKQVSQTFPGIILTHFCKNSNYNSTKKVAFPIGFYVFWEIVVKKVLEIASQLGCQYLYLFAADNTEPVPTQSSFLYSDDWDEYESETDTTPVYKLVEYYKNELKFEDVQDVTILKPYYDFPCFSLIQKIGALQEHRNAAWIQRSDVNT